MEALPARRSSARAWILAAGAAAGAAVTATLLALSANSIGPAIAAVSSGAVPHGPGLGALCTIAVVGLTIALALAGEPRLQETRP
jgi:hypothetical protein